jgi:hypothetical protein
MGQYEVVLGGGIHNKGHFREGGPKNQDFFGPKKDQLAYLIFCKSKMPPEFGIRNGKQGIDHSHLQHKPMLVSVALLLVKFILSKSTKDVLKFIFFYKFSRYISVNWE